MPPSPLHPDTNPNGPDPSAPPVDALLLGRALAAGVGVAGAAFALAWLVGAFPEGATWFAAVGALAAVGAALVAVFLHGRFLSRDATRRFGGDGRLLAGHLQSLLAAAFAVKLAFVVLGVLVLRQQGVKFTELATFAVTFAAVSLLCQMATAGFLARAIQPKTGKGALHRVGDPGRASPS